MLRHNRTNIVIPLLVLVRFLSFSSFWWNTHPPYHFSPQQQQQQQQQQQDDASNVTSLLLIPSEETRGDSRSNTSHATTKKKKKTTNPPEPIAILHFGPRKTATTTIQFALAHSHTTQLLAHDSFVYLGKDQTQNTLYDTMARPYVWKCMYEQQQRHCISENNSNSNNHTNNNTHNETTTTTTITTTTQSKWTHFIDHVEKARLQGKSVIVSDEALHRMLHQSTSNMQQILNVFQKFSQVRVIFGYRRYFEWIVSEYNEEMKTNAIIPAMSFVDWYYKQQSSSSSGNGTKPSRPFARLDGAALQRFQAVFASVQMLNLHEENDLTTTTATTTATGIAATSSSSSSSAVVSSTNTIMTNFLCRMIPEAQQACEAARAGTLVPPDQDEPLNLSVDYVDSSYIAQQVIQQVYNDNQKNILNKTKTKKKKNTFTKRQAHHQLVIEIQSHFDRSMAMGTTTTTPTAKNDTTTLQPPPTTMTNTSISGIYSTIPKRCLSKEELEQLFQQSLQIERDVLWLSSSSSSSSSSMTTTTTWSSASSPSPSSPLDLAVQPPLTQRQQQQQHQEEVFRNAFATYVEKGKFCGVDFERLWDNIEWRTLLTQIAQNILQQQKEE
jgi:hypothetical protein